MASSWFLPSSAASTFCVQDRLVVEVLDADADAVDLVGVRRADAAAGGADLALAEEAFRHLVEVAWYGVIRCALPLISSFDVSTPRSFSPLSSESRTAGSTTTPLPMTGVQLGREDAGREQVQRVLLVADDDRVAGVVAALVADDVVDGATEQVGGLALALVTPLSAEQHKCGHRRTPLPGGACPRSGAGVRHSLNRRTGCPGIDEAPGAIAQGALAQRCYPRKDRGVGSEIADLRPTSAASSCWWSSTRSPGEWTGSPFGSRKTCCARGAGAKVCLPDGPEEFARALARRGPRRPVVIGDDRALLRAVALLHRQRELAAGAVGWCRWAARRCRCALLGVPTGAVAAARAVLDGAARAAGPAGGRQRRDGAGGAAHTAPPARSAGPREFPGPPGPPGPPRPPTHMTPVTHMTRATPSPPEKRGTTSGCTVRGGCTEDGGCTARGGRAGRAARGIRRTRRIHGAQEACGGTAGAGRTPAGRGCARASPSSGPWCPPGRPGSPPSPRRRDRPGCGSRSTG